MRRYFTAIGMFAGTLVASIAIAHPLGDFSLNQYSLIDLRGDVPVIHWQIDIAEIPSFREMDLLDSDLDGVASDAEMEAYLNARIPEWLGNFVFTLDGQLIPLTLTERRLRILEGNGGQPVFQTELSMRAEGFTWPAADAASVIEFRSYNHENAQGYREAKILLDGRYPIEIGPWDEGEYKYLQTVAVDELDNPLFQSFYNVFRMELGPARGPAQPLDHSPDFDWTATAQFTDRPTEVIASLRTTYEADGPVQDLAKLDAILNPPPPEPSEEQLAFEKALKEAPEPLSGEFSVATPRTLPSNALDEEPLPDQPATNARFMLGVALALGAAFLAVAAVFRAIRDKS